jgi:hypothetical protein
MKALVKELKYRSTANTPKFWKNVQIVGACIVGIGTLIVTAPVSLPVGVVSLGTYLITVGGTITGLAQLTKE